MAHPKATSRPPAPMSTPSKKTQSLRRPPAPSGSRSRIHRPRSRRPTTTKVRSSMRPSAPNRLASRRPQARSSPVALWPGPGTTSVNPEKARKPSAAEQTGPDQDVLVGEGQQGPPVLVTHHGPEHGVGPRGPVDGGQPDQQGRGPADALEGGERVAPELRPFADPGDQHPLLPLFRQEPDIESGLPFSAQIGHFGQLGVTDRCAVLGLHLDGHMPFRTPRSPCGTSRRPRSAVDAPCPSPGGTDGSVGLHARSRPRFYGI